MYIRPAWRGQGVGRALVEQALDIARQRGWRRVDVTTPRTITRTLQAVSTAAAGSAQGEKLRLLLDH